MNRVRSFYLDVDVLAILDQWPLRERSRAVNKVLSAHLRPPGEQAQPAVGERRIKELIHEMLAEFREPNRTQHVLDNKRALQALAGLFDMREEEG